MKNYIETCLYGYKANKYKLYLLRSKKRELSSLRTKSCISLEGGSSSLSSVEDTLEKTLAIEKEMKEVKAKVNIVNKLKKDLMMNDSESSRQMLSLLQRKYITHCDNEIVRAALSVSWATYWRRNRELLKLATKYFPSEKK